MALQHSATLERLGATLAATRDASNLTELLYGLVCFMHRSRGRPNPPAHSVVDGRVETTPKEDSGQKRAAGFTMSTACLRRS